MMRAIVTGATSGIGAATVLALRNIGHDVLAVARRRNRLEALGTDTGAKFVSSDVRNIVKLAEEIDAFEPDILVNNAGVGHGIDGFVGVGPELVQEAVDINVTSLVQLTGAVLPGMIAREAGHIINIGSISGLHTISSALYGATKAAVHIFSQNLRAELIGAGIRVTEICPGRVASEFYEAAAGDRNRLDRMGAPGIRALDPEDVAAAILYAVGAPTHVNVATIELLPTDQAVGGVKTRTSNGAT
ncbi:MAG: SDR family NAD(P)-dependent oxidoreductase [Gemmatimonadetes bacterium]|nr:SDR family NAD(P)-dependent oxidoreductase [Gemmatimonadota bacterium]